MHPLQGRSLMSPKKRRCSCGHGWSVKRTKLKDGSVVENYWCELCDGRAFGDGTRPEPEG